MPWTPAEILHQRFRRQLLGYSVKEVEGFRYEVSETVRQLTEDNRTLRDEKERLQEQLQTYMAIEQQLRDALVIAEKTADEVRQLARKEAELIVAEAKREAERLKAEAQQQAKQALDEAERTHQLRLRLETELKQLLHSYLALLNRAAQSDPSKQN